MIGSNPASHHQCRFASDIRKLLAEPSKPTADTVLQGTRYGLLERSADVGNVLIGKRRNGRRCLPHGRFQTGEGEVQPCFANHWTGQRKLVRISCRCSFLDGRSTWIRQPQKFRRLVEGLAQRIVDGRAPAFILPHATNKNELRVTAGDQQHQIGKRQTIGQTRRQRVAFQMVDRIKRLAGRLGNRFAGHQTDDQATDQTWPGGGGDGINIGQGHACLLERFLDKRVERFNVSTCSNFRHHTAISAVFVELRQNDIRNDLSTPVGMANHYGCSGFITARLYAKDTKKGGHQPVRSLRSKGNLGTETPGNNG